MAPPPERAAVCGLLRALSEDHDAARGRRRAARRRAALARRRHEHSAAAHEPALASRTDEDVDSLRADGTRAPGRRARARAGCARSLSGTLRVSDARIAAWRAPRRGRRSTCSTRELGAALIAVTGTASALARGGSEALLDQHVGDLVGGRLELLAAVDDLGDGVVDVQRLRARLVLVVPDDLLRDVDEAAGVDGVVGRVEDAARVEVVAVARNGELVVRGAGDDARLEPRDGVVVQGRAERARGEHVAVDVEDGVERDDRRAELAVRTLGLERRRRRRP